MLPVWRGGVGVDQHVASARAVVAAGGVFALIPEGGVSGPPDQLAPFRFGSALIALRLAAPILPIAIAGTDELYLGRADGDPAAAADHRRPSCSAGTGRPAASCPSRAARAELDLAHRLTERLADLLGPAVTELYPRTVDPPGRPRRLRGLTWLFLARAEPTRG